MLQAFYKEQFNMGSYGKARGDQKLLSTNCISAYIRNIDI